MRVVFVVRSVPPVIDGVGDYTWQLTRFLRSEGIDAHVVTSTNQDMARGLGQEWVHPVVPRWTGRAVVEAIAATPVPRPDWCIFQYVPQMYGPRGICWAASGVARVLRPTLKCRVATTFHEFASAGGWDPKNAVLAIVMGWQTRRLLEGSDLAITTCSRYAQHLKALALRALPVVTIPVGANIEPARLPSDKIVALRRHYSLNGSKVFGMIGQLSPVRNFSTAIRVLERARDQGLKSALLLIGRVEPSNPGLYAKLRCLARELGVDSQVLVTGELSAEDVSAHLRLVDVFLFPQGDGISTRNTTVMTALAHGLRIISYAPQSGNFDGYRVPEGALVPLGDEESFIRAAVASLRGMGDNSEGSKPNSQYFEEHFSWSRIGKRYIDALTTVG